MKQLTRVALVMSLSISLGLPPAWSQPAGIPSMGSASGAELSPNLERTLGDAIMEQGRRDPHYVAEPVITQYLTQLGQKLAKHSPVPLHYPIQVFGMRDASINAFALPGGYVGINTGLITAAESESELASVVAHEIAHVAQRHVARGMTQNSGSNHLVLASLVGALLAGLAGSADLAMGVATFGQAAAVDRQLGFSRQAEQEADRVGYQMLKGAGYNPEGMAVMFKRLMQSARLNESGQSYATTHPLSAQRLADVENRLMSSSAATAYSESDDFWFVQAAALALQATSGSALQSLQQRFQSLASNRSGAAQAAALYGLAYIAKNRKNYTQAQQYLNQAQQLHVGSPLLDVLQIELEIDQAQFAKALSTAQSAWQRWPQNQAVALGVIAAMQKQAPVSTQIDFLQQRIQQWPEEARFYQLLAQALEKNNQPIAARETMAQYYVLVGAVSSAVSQLQQARTLSTDFYEQSTLDTRIRELREQLERDRLLLERFKG
ncbi:MAG TPA: M48 family metalloprotease [Paenalcaligenes hominis]|uniref:M48 family metalloprotease n=1 Tax=Paenalcaligenes hominis TaxID=643674 RepID=A0A9D3ABV5_9BURK|nr:M48 family metalloprotease [Paenalcaligenes hominis]NJB66250.1 putative Zn-dependent protease [Paenalcaligenes hominis]GGE74384.1 exported protein [Paenalcaligenes hominis]HJH24830.1 M48 family metalloprotease [Paenalcaligenes hominis]